MNATPPDEPEHDAMLRAALRHAPDRDARPPEAVSAQILRRAQQATALPTASSSGVALQAVRRWLSALTRPAPAAAFASLMLATVIGVMWREGPPPLIRDGDEPPSTQVLHRRSPAASEAGASERDAALGIDASRRTAPEAAPAASKRPVVPPPAAPAAASPSARSAPRAQAQGEPKVPAAVGAAAPGSIAPPEAAARPGLRREASSASDEARKSATADTATRRADDEARRASTPADAKTSAEAGASRERDTAAPASPQAASPGRAESARSAPIEPSRNMLAAPVDPLAALAEGWADASEAQRAALDELRRLSAGRWSRVPMPDAVPATELRRADGRALGRLGIVDDAVLWFPQGGDGLVWRAPLEPGAAADLRRRLAMPVR